MHLGRQMGMGMGMVRAGLVAAVLSISLTGIAAAADPVYTGIFSNTALGGHDAVAYFTDGEPVEGSRNYTTMWNGAEWRFSSAANRQAFLDAPERYAPQYGGYCAWAIAEGKLAKGDPAYWRIVDDRLYLNYNADIQARWEADIAGFIERADANWPDILK